MVLFEICVTFKPFHVKYRSVNMLSRCVRFILYENVHLCFLSSPMYFVLSVILKNFHFRARATTKIVRPEDKER